MEHHHERMNFWLSRLGITFKSIAFDGAVQRQEDHAPVGRAEVLGRHVLSDEFVGRDLLDGDPILGRDEDPPDEVLRERVRGGWEGELTLDNLGLGLQQASRLKGKTTV